MSNGNILTAFNNHFEEFLTDINRVFPENVDIKKAQNGLLAIRKANPKIIISIWSGYIIKGYNKEIEMGDINFFIKKDYANDFSQNPYAEKIMQGIDRLREPVKSMNNDDQAKVIKYIQNLTKLASIYENTA
jgi:hypothetical protein